MITSQYSCPRQERVWLHGVAIVVLFCLYVEQGDRITRLTQDVENSLSQEQSCVPYLQPSQPYLSSLVYRLRPQKPAPTTSPAALPKRQAVLAPMRQLAALARTAGICSATASNDVRLGVKPAMHVGLPAMAVGVESP